MATTVRYCCRLEQEHAGPKKEGYANMAPVDPGDCANH